MPDNTQQPNPETVPTPMENQNSEINSTPASPQEPTAETPIPPSPSDPVKAMPDEAETSPSPEGAIPVNNDISANEPFESTPVPENVPIPDNPNITVEKRGNDVTITEVMKPEPEPKTETAQMAGNESLNSESDQTKIRKENLIKANEKRRSKKREKIDEILTLFSEKKEITNDEVEKLLHISDATATRYLETLEKEGKIKQVGKTGKSVNYIKI